VVAAAMLGWAIPTELRITNSDECSKSLQTRLDDMKAKAEASKRSMEQK
jgi:hypothetical protein